MKYSDALLMALLAIALSACNDSQSSNQPNAPQVSAATGQAVSFVAFGDAGQQAGTGPANQTAVGDAMAKVCELRGCDFAIELGDNIYLSGVDSVEDEQWQTKFEQPYANFNYPIYAALGNHDNSNG